MKKGNKQIIILGDRVLIKPLANETRTKMGLYLPQTVQEKEEVLTGIVTETGPGIPMADPNSMMDEPWKKQNEPVKYIPMQVEVGDVVIFLKKAAVEVSIENEKFFIAPQSAILVIIRDDIDPLEDLENKNFNI
jgi:co-chaperonin GroES (HSP10)